MAIDNKTRNSLRWGFDHANCQPCLQYHKNRLSNSGGCGEIAEAIEMGSSPEGAADKMDEFSLVRKTADLPAAMEQISMLRLTWRNGISARKGGSIWGGRGDLSPSKAAGAAPGK